MLLPALIRLLREWGDVVVTLVVPKHKHPRSWWPHLQSFARQSLRLSERGQTGVLETPSKDGYKCNDVGLPFELWAFKCYFPQNADLPREPCLPERHLVFVISDSMFRDLAHFGWPSAMEVVLHVCRGGKMESLCRLLASCCRSRVPALAILHGGINDFSRSENGVEKSQELLRVFEISSARLRVQFPTVQFVLSGVCRTTDHYTNRIVAEVNEGFQRLCGEHGWRFLSNDYISQEDLVDQVHLSTWGSLRMHRRLQLFIRSALGLRTGMDIDVC